MEHHNRAQAFCPKIAQVDREVTWHVAERQRFPSYAADQMTFRCCKRMRGWKFKQLVESHNAEVEDASRKLDKTERCLVRYDLATVAFNSMEPLAPLWQVLVLMGVGAILSVRAKKSRY